MATVECMGGLFDGESCEIDGGTPWLYLRRAEGVYLNPYPLRATAVYCYEVGDSYADFVRAEYLDRQPEEE